MDCNRKYIFPSLIYNALLEHLRSIHNPLQGYDICQEEKKKNNSARTSHQGFPWSLLLGFVALKGKMFFIMLVPSLPNKEPPGLFGMSHCIHSGILCGFLFLCVTAEPAQLFSSPGIIQTLYHAICLTWESQRPQESELWRKVQVPEDTAEASHATSAQYLYRSR